MTGEDEGHSIESRIVALEATLGLLPKKGDEVSDVDDLGTRVAQLEEKYKSLAPSSLNNLWEESDGLIKDLHPGSSLTYQQPLTTRNNYPVIYRKQQVLASSKSLQRDMDYLTNIVNLLLISQSGGGVSEETVMQAPILASVQVTPEQEKRLDTLRLQTADAQNKTEELAQRMDSLVRTYQTILTSLSERMLQLEQKLETK